MCNGVYLVSSPGLEGLSLHFPPSHPDHVPEVHHNQNEKQIHVGQPPFNLCKHSLRFLSCSLTIIRICPPWLSQVNSSRTSLRQVTFRLGSMDQVSIKKRSASHGSLHSCYKTHARGTLTHHPSHHRPLRSVNENTALLPSPGPLESMLKTTTETGDIGIFSIRPVLPSVIFHQLPRRRPSFGDSSLVGPSSSRGTDDSAIHDDRRGLPSYRDTTSEIISMYGSDSQQSWSSSLSPPLDELGQRSYSMTTCGSRHLSTNKSTGTLQSQSSGSMLQRPRSPFPYPTRLKRPGVRPASPALTENGSIDYSRMVEIDRVSYVRFVEAY
jgi:hypothetical protein